MSFKLWLRKVEGDKIASDIILEGAGKFNEENYFNALMEAAQALDISTPVTLKTHFKELSEFRCTKYSPSDFMESTDFSLDVSVMDDAV